MVIPGGALRVDFNPEPIILDMCMAPGGFLDTVLSINPRGIAHAFSLPFEQGGHQVLLSRRPEIVIKHVDITTMLAEDMGVATIPSDHVDAHSFMPRQFPVDLRYDLIICDGQVLRTQCRAKYRDKTEARRLTITQLALGLQRLRTNGTMVVLLHKVEAWETVKLLYNFAQFATLRLFKPCRAHKKRSSFHLIATNVDNTHPAAIRAIQTWRAIWRAATFETEETYDQIQSMHELDVKIALAEFGPNLIALGRKIWRIQAQFLAEAPFMQASGRPVSQ